MCPFWSEIEDASLFLNTEVDQLWPVDQEEGVGEEQYPYPYQIDTAVEEGGWKEKE